MEGRSSLISKGPRGVSIAHILVRISRFKDNVFFFFSNRKVNEIKEGIKIRSFSTAAQFSRNQCCSLYSVSHEKKKVFKM